MRKSVKNERIEEIYSSALKVFAEKGFNKATLDEIAEMVDITKPALYFYFKSKDDLFFSLIKSRFLKLNEVLDNVFEQNIDSMQKLKNYIDTFLGFFKTNKNFFTILMNMPDFNFQFKNKNLRKRIRANMFEHITKIKNLIQQCMNDGYLQKKNPYFYVFALQGMLNQILFHSSHIKGFIDMGDLEINTDDILDMFINGAGTEKVREVLK